MNERDSQIHPLRQIDSHPETRTCRHPNRAMKYYLVEPVADAEIGEEADISFAEKPREIRSAHIRRFSAPESDLIQAYPVFVISKRLQAALQSARVTGATYLPCKVSKSDQYDELSTIHEVPEMVCLEPCGRDGADDVVFYSETKIKVSEHFVQVLECFSSIGCRIREADQ